MTGRLARLMPAAAVAVLAGCRAEPTLLGEGRVKALPAAAAGGTRFVAGDGSLALTVPPGWTATPQPAGGAALELHPETGPDQVALVATTTSLPQGLRPTPELLTATFGHDLPRHWQGTAAELLGHHEVAFGTRHALVLEARLGGSRLKQYLFFANGRQYTLSAVAPEAGFGGLEPTFDALAAGFEPLQEETR